MNSDGTDDATALTVKRVGIDTYRENVALSGAPKIGGAGIDLFRKIGDAVSRGEP